ncbi:MAG: SAM-dependent methyltransferase [Caldilineaceae bacterium]
MNYFILTADPDFVDLALAEVRRAHAHVVETLAPGVLLAEAKQPFETLAEAWRTNPPIFVRHICPIQHIVPLQAVADADLAALRAGVTEEIAPLVEPDFAFSVQTRILTDLPYKPFDVNNALAEVIQSATQAPLNVRAPQQILSVVCATRPEGIASTTYHSSLITHHVAFLGLSLTLHNLSDWAGGVRRFAREEGQVSRSEFKLLEALAVFQIDLPSHGVALDLGASPGGWTRVLRQRDQYVTAVDPGDLDPRVAKDRGVRQKRMTAEEYLADEPDQFDIIVNDMRMDARDSARLMLKYAGQLQRHGLVIMTLKLPEQNREPVLDHAFNILREGYTIAGARQLFHNRSEITVYLRLKE